MGLLRDTGSAVFAIETPLLEWVVRDGRLLRRNRRSAFLAETEGMDTLHQQGLEDLREVRAAYAGGAGKTTAIPRTKPTG